MSCAALPTPEQLDQTELRFLEDFCNLMVTAHYRLLTEQEWQTATDEEFTVSFIPACPHLHRTFCSQATVTWMPYICAKLLLEMPAVPMDNIAQCVL